MLITRSGMRLDTTSDSLRVLIRFRKALLISICFFTLDLAIYMLEKIEIVLKVQILQDYNSVRDHYSGGNLELLAQ